MSISSGDDGCPSPHGRSAPGRIDIHRTRRIILLSPLGERLGEGVMQKIILVLHPLT